jgi:hypothetical protein
MLRNMNRPSCDRQAPANSLPLRRLRRNLEELAGVVDADHLLRTGAIPAEVDATVGADRDIVGRGNHEAALGGDAGGVPAGFGVPER